jgi:hypothetical protein
MTVRGKFLSIKHFMQEFLDSASGFIIASCTHSPEIPDTGNIFFPRHPPVQSCVTERFRVNSPVFAKGFLEYGPCHKLCCPRGNGGFRSEPGIVAEFFSPIVFIVASNAAISALSVAHITQSIFQIITLNINYYAICQSKTVTVVGCGKGF